MRILIVNDDGIHAAGIYHLAKAAMDLGEVWVTAPREQCSAMSHHITLGSQFLVRREHILDGVNAFSIDGTPADCVKVAVNHLMPQRPDLVLSGINNGYNTGIDILYSGTVAATMEALLHGIPAMAFSINRKGDPAIIDRYLMPLLQELRQRPIASNEIWNINFPGCAPEEIRGILYDRLPSNQKVYKDDVYIESPLGDGEFVLKQTAQWVKVPEEGTDIAAVRENYISVGKVQNMVLRPKSV